MTGSPAPDVLPRFSGSVRRAVASLGTSPVAAADIAGALLELHPEYVDGRLTVEPGGVRRDVMDWLWHCWSLFDPDRTGDVVDGRLAILGLARIDEPLDRALRRGGRRRLELRRTFADMAWGWAQRPHVRAFSELASFGGGAACALNRDGTRVATVAEDGVTLWDVATTRPRVGPSGRSANFVAFSPADDTLAIAEPNGLVLVGGEASGRLIDGPVGDSAFSPDGGTIAVPATGELQLHAIGSKLIIQSAPPGSVTVAYSRDGRLLASATRDAVEIKDVGGGQVAQIRVTDVRGCAFTPDGRRLLTVCTDGSAKLWEIATARGRALPPVGDAWALSPDGRVLVAATGTWDVASGLPLNAALPSAIRAASFSGDGRMLAVAGGDGTTRVVEILAGARDLPAVAPDSVDGVDLLGLQADASALADVIAAGSTQPPLSIGLFADWGSGKSFLIELVQQRVRELSKRAAKVRDTAHCAHVRNVQFNAWHYADANLWASLATHIFAELAKPDDADAAAGRDAAAQFARLEERLVAESTLRQELERQRAHAKLARARRALLRWTWGLAAPAPQQTLADVERGFAGLAGDFRLVLPTWRSRLIVTLVPLAIGFIALYVLGADTIAQVGGSVAAGVVTATSWIGVGARRVSTLLERAGASARVKDVRVSDPKGELQAARAREAELRAELADLNAGRRLARYAAERATAGDYRSQLSVVSHIYDDFKRMSDILALQADRGGDPDTGDVPRIDRVVLYIDDLDRCPPKRVVEVLEAVHLILALRLFVVVLAVDPRWLLQSLELHYSELLADDVAERWKSTPLDWLEKIIQIPFTLAPMTGDGVASLVRGLLPVAAAAVPTAPRHQGGGDGPASSPSTVAAPAAAPPESAIPPSPPANVNPRTLALTPEEREFAIAVARRLKTPRSVKKLTNLYRLLRARLDEEAGELDVFLDRSGPDIPECEAALMMLAVVLRFPDEASAFLRSLGTLEREAAPDGRTWVDQRDALRTRHGELAAFLDGLTESAVHGATSSREPFRRWALEVSRYSFATGQEVYAARR